MNKQQLKTKLFKKTGCDIQHTGWCCGSCFFNISETLNNEDWQSLLYYRGDYKKKDLNNLPKDWKLNIEKIMRLL